MVPYARDAQTLEPLAGRVQDRVHGVLGLLALLLHGVARLGACEWDGRVLVSDKRSNMIAQSIHAIFHTA